MADDVKRTLLLNFKTDTKGVTDLGKLFTDVENQAKEMLAAQTKLLEDSIKAAEQLAKAQAKEAKIAAAAEAKEKKEQLKQELADVKAKNKALAEEEKKANAERLAQAKQVAAELQRIQAFNTYKANAQAGYAKQQIKDEENLAAKTRQITIDALKRTIEERNAIINAASKQRLGTAISDITSAESADRKKLLTNLRQDMTERAKLQQEEFNLIERALQQTRAREAERAKIEEAAARQRLERQAAVNRQLLANETDFNERQRQNQLRGMRSSATAAFSEMPVAGRVPPIPRVPEDVRSSYDSLFARIGAINIEYRLWNEAINTVTNSLRAIPKIGIELEATKSVLAAVMGTSAGMMSTLEALDKEAERTGMSLEAIRTSFRTFSASTTLAGESLDSTWKMFTNLNSVITALHLSTDQANHVFLALSQIFNKSKVQSEELVKQLGNLLPGAFASFAKSMGISTMELSKQMKDGLVFAHNNVEEFTTFMANRFAHAFDSASQGLNANINRMQSSFTKLGEALYEVTGGPLQATVKGITNLTTYFTAAVKGENDFISTTTTLAEVLGGALVAGFLATAKPATALMEALYAAATAATVLKNNLLAIGSTAVLAAVSAVLFKMQEIGLKQAALAKQAREDVENFSNAKKKADMALPLEVRVEADPDIVALKKRRQAYTEEYNRMLSERKGGQAIWRGEEGSESLDKAMERTLSAIKINTEQLKSTRARVQDSIEVQDAEFRKNQITQGVDLTKNMEAAEVAALKAKGKNIEAIAKEFDNRHKEALANAENQQKQYENQIADFTKRNKNGLYDVQISDAQAAIIKLKKYKDDLALERTDLIQKEQDRLDKKSISSNKSAAAEKLRGIKEEIKVDDQLLQTAANNAQEQIKLLNKSNDAKMYSFEEYARRKKEILTKDYNTEKEWLEKQLALAQGSGKKDLVATYSEKLKRLKTDFETQVGTKGTAGIIDTETAKNLQDYETNISMIHEKYRDILGLERDSNDLTSVKLGQLRKQIELESTEKGIQGERAKQALIELDTWQKAKNLKADFQTYQKSLTNADKIASDALARNNELRQTGNMTELQFLMSNTKIKKEQIRLSEIEIEKMRQRLATASESEKPAVQAQYDLAVQRLESLKLVADETGAFIENALGTAFESSFEGLITKSMTASQAFKAFANSVAEDIAKIIAQEMRSQIIGAILKPLAGSALSSLGGAIGGSVGGSLSSYGTNLLAAKPNALGGVYSGAGISAHSGTIVSSPTVFPFAKGIGLMGEAGPEAILPLKRNSQGKLGVSVENAGQNKGNLYNITVNVQSKQGENPEQFGQRAATAMMRSIAKEEISNARRPGNTLNKARFG